MFIGGICMKKFMFLTLVVSLFIGVSTVSAMTEAELKAKLSQTIKVGGQDFTLDANTKAYVEKYLNENDVSAADGDYIAGKIDEAITILQNEGKTNFSELSTTAKNNLKALVQNVNDNTSVKATVTGGSVVVYNNSGTPFFEVTKLVKQSGFETSTVAIITSLSVLVVAAGAFFVTKQVKAN